MQETFKEALKGKKVGLVRADSGFYTEELLSYLEEEEHNYIMAVRMYPNVKSAVWGLENWVSLAKGIELNQMFFSHEKGKLRRYIMSKSELTSVLNPVEKSFLKIYQATGLVVTSPT